MREKIRKESKWAIRTTRKINGQYTHEQMLKTYRTENLSN